jgi:hypothetical protein
MFKNEAAVFSDQDIFPGWTFTDDDLTSKEDQASKDLQQPRILDVVSSFNENQRKALEKRIISKHTQYGAISMFKGVEDITFMKSRNRAKQEIQRIRQEIRDCEEDIASMETALAENRVCLFLFYEQDHTKSLFWVIDYSR